MRIRETKRFLESHSRSAKLTSSACQVLPDGITRETIRRRPRAPFMIRGEGTRLIDADGDERIDLLFNHASLIHGHTFPPVVDAIRQQVGRLGAVPFPTVMEQELARILTDRVAIDEPVVRLTNSGTEAVALAVQTACALTSRRRVLRFAGCYHGSFPPSPGAMAAWPGSDDYLTAPYNSSPGVRAAFAAHGHDIGCVLIDLCPTHAALARASPEFLEMILAECQRHQVPLIVDEVISSRTAINGLSSILGVAPDIVCLGKYIGGGLPVGAVVLRATFSRLYTSEIPKRVEHGGTFNGNPLTTAAGVAALAHFGATEIGRLNEVTNQLSARLEETFARRRVTWSVRNSGSLFCLWPTKSLPDAPPRDRLEAERRALADLSSFLLQHGVIVAPSGLGCLSTATHSNDLDYLVAAVDHYLSRKAC